MDEKHFHHFERCSGVYVFWTRRCCARVFASVVVRFAYMRLARMTRAHTLNVYATCRAMRLHCIFYHCCLNRYGRWVRLSPRPSFAACRAFRGTVSVRPHHCARYAPGILNA